MISVHVADCLGCGCSPDDHVEATIIGDLTGLWKEIVDSFLSGMPLPMSDAVSEHILAKGLWCQNCRIFEYDLEGSGPPDEVDRTFNFELGPEV